MAFCGSLCPNLLFSLFVSFLSVALSGAKGNVEIKDWDRE